ncbi:MAG: zinc ribbon domain-containing protein, partial [Polyangiaceae bacterium]
DEQVAPARALAEKVAQEYLVRRRLAPGPGDAAPVVQSERFDCASCGASNEPDAAFCKRCGASMKAPGVVDERP